MPTAYLSRSETATAAGSTAGVGVLCSAIGLWNAPAGVLCAASVWNINDGAIRAVSHGKCIKIVFSIVSQPFEFTCQQ